MVAQRQVRDCFVGRFPEDGRLAITSIKPLDVPYNIQDIHDAVVDLDERPFCKEYLTFQKRRSRFQESGEEKRLKTLEDINKQGAAIEKEYEEAINTTEINQKYSQSEAEQRVEGC